MTDPYMMYMPNNYVYSEYQPVYTPEDQKEQIKKQV